MGLPLKQSRKAALTPMLSSLERRYLFCCLFCSAFLIIASFVRFNTKHNYQSQSPQNDNHWHARKVNNRKICRLKAYDPWDQRVVPYLHPESNRFKDCIPTLIMQTQLVNGTFKRVNVKQAEGHCFYRCLNPGSELNFTSDPWREIKLVESYHLNCDFVETYCTDNKDDVIYRYIHQQVVQNKMRLYQKEDRRHASVFIFAFDSTSASSLARTLMQTNQVLRQYYDATMFYYHNKVGINTRPNAFAMFTGQRITELDGIEFPGKNESEVTNSCEFGVAKNVSVIYKFLEQNYASLITEDWPTIFSYPNCNGYGKVIVDHYSVPLIHRMIQSDIYPFFLEKECQLEFHKIVQYADAFLNTYKGFAKYAMVWASRLSHDDANGLYFTDKIVAEFFRNNVENLRNSFIFVMGDHGIRHTGIRHTEPGEHEDNNPALIVAVPEFVRNNRQLRTNILRNARTHTSQYDFYATLYDIAQLAPKTAFRKWDWHDFRKDFGEARGARGTSLFRPINKIRTCIDMEIPYDLCICLEEWKNLSPTDPMVREAGEMVVATVNDIIKSRKLDEKCATLHYVGAVNAKLQVNEPILHIKAMARPSMGLYDTRLYVEEDGTFRLASQVMERYKKKTIMYANLLGLVIVPVLLGGLLQFVPEFIVSTEWRNDELSIADVMTAAYEMRLTMLNYTGQAQYAFNFSSYSTDAVEDFLENYFEEVQPLYEFFLDENLFANVHSSYQISYTYPNLLAVLISSSLTEENQSIRFHSLYGRIYLLVGSFFGTIILAIMLVAMVGFIFRMIQKIFAALMNLPGYHNKKSHKYAMALVRRNAYITVISLFTYIGSIIGGAAIMVFDQKWSWRMSLVYIQAAATTSGHTQYRPAPIDVNQCTTEFVLLLFALHLWLISMFSLVLLSVMATVQRIYYLQWTEIDDDQIDELEKRVEQHQLTRNWDKPPYQDY